MKSKSMELNIGLSYRLALMGGVLLSLSALSAQGQTVIRRSAYSRQTTFANGQTMTIYSPYATYPNYAYQNYAVNRYANAFGSINPNVNPNALPLNGAAGAVGAQPPLGPPPQAQASDAVTAQYAGSSQLLVQWTGNSSGVRQITLGVFDASGNMLTSQTLTQLPVVARFPMTADVAYYGAQVHYASGKVTTTYQPLQ